MEESKQLKEFPRRRRSRLFPPEGLPLPVALGRAALVYPFLWVPIVGVGLAWWDGQIWRAKHIPPTILVSLIVAVFVALGTGWLAMGIGFVFWHVARLGTRSMRVRIARDLLAASVGGWTALAMVAVIAYAAGPVFDLPAPDAAWCAAIVVGPGLGTLIGQYVGAWSQWSMGRVRRVRGARQFGIFQLLVATAWIAVALAGLKLAGLLETRPLVYLGGWLVWQTATLPMVLHVCRRRNERYWRERRRREGDDGGMRE